MAQLPAPYFYGSDRYVRKYDELQKKYLYWPWPKSALTGNYVTLDLANYLFDTVEGAENDLITVEQLPAGVSDTGGSYSDDLQTMADQGNRIEQSLITGGYSMDQFPASQKERRKGLATVDITDYQDYGSQTETREGISVLGAIDLDQQIHSTVGLSAEQFMAIASVQGVLVPFLTPFEGRTVQKIAQVSLSTLIGIMMPAIIAQLPNTSPTNPTNPTKVLTDFNIDGIDRIVEGVMDSLFRASVIYSDGTTGFVTTQGASVDGFSWDIPKASSQGEQISLTGILPIYPNDVVGDGRTFVLELRHSSLPKVARKTITIVDGTTAPPPPTTTDPFIELLIDVDSRTIRVRYRLSDTTRAALVVFRDGVAIYSNDNLPASYDTSLNQTVLPGTYYARVFQPNKDSNFKQSDPQTIKGTPAGSSVVTAIDYAHLAKGADGYPELDLWFKSSVVEDIQFTLVTEDLPETQALSTKVYSDANGYSRAQQLTNTRGGQLVTVKAWTSSNQGGAVSKQFRITAGAARTTIFGAGATNPPADTATTILALDTEWGSDGSLTIYGKTSKADGLQFAVANDAGQYSGWFGAGSLNGDSAGYQYKGGFSASAPGSKARIRYRPTANSAESAIAYLTLTTPATAQARKTEWANGTQIQPVSGDFRIDYADSNLGGGPRPQFRLLPIWNDAGTEVRFERIFTGQIDDGYQEYWTFDKEGLVPDPNKAVNPYQGRSIRDVISFPPNYNVDIECYWARGSEVNRGYSSNYCSAIGKATIYTGTKPQNI